jgi:hypothetical protein
MCHLTQHPLAAAAMLHQALDEQSILLRSLVGKPGNEPPLVLPCLTALKQDVVAPSGRVRSGSSSQGTQYVARLRGHADL